MTHGLSGLEATTAHHVPPKRSQNTSASLSSICLFHICSKIDNNSPGSRTRMLPPIFLTLLLPALSIANSRQPDPGSADDTLCTVAVLGMLDTSPPSLNNTLLLWPKSSCCTTTDCQLQKFTCPFNAAHSDSKGDICCYKASGDGADAGTCKCGIDQEMQGTCF
jgi:hypothetical protein